MTHVAVSLMVGYVWIRTVWKDEGAAAVESWAARVKKACAVDRCFIYVLEANRHLLKTSNQFANYNFD